MSGWGWLLGSNHSLRGKTEVLFDPQTSGGLLFAVDPADAATLEQELRAAGLSASIVGEILPKQKIEITVTDK